MLRRTWLRPHDGLLDILALVNAARARIATAINVKTIPPPQEPLAAQPAPPKLPAARSMNARTFGVK